MAPIDATPGLQNKLPPAVPSVGISRMQDETPGRPPTRIHPPDICIERMRVGSSTPRPTLLEEAGQQHSHEGRDRGDEKSRTQALVLGDVPDERRRQQEAETQ